MDLWKKTLIHLTHCSGIGWNTLTKIINEDRDLKNVYRRSDQYWQRIIHNCTVAKLKGFLIDLENKQLREKYHTYQKQGINILTIIDEYYPYRLREIINPPWVIYCHGDIKLLEAKNILAIIGSRQPSKYGVTMTVQLASELISYDVVIISGLARGIDATAQKYAINNNGKVIAVIAGGINNIYPKEHAKLAKQIIAEGLVISEYPPDAEPKPWHFPMRNRLISGLSRGILVVEARQKSGTFITVKHGLDQGKDVFALPGPINSCLSVGPNSLIREGAILVQSGQNIFEEWSCDFAN